MARKRERRSRAGRQQQPGTTPSTGARAGGSLQDITGVTVWEPRWDAFLAAHPTWQIIVSRDEPVYCLPDEVIRSLFQLKVGRGPRAPKRPAVITLEEATAEKAFRECCQGFSDSVVGVWQGQPVRYGLLGDHGVPDLSEDDIRAMGWDRYLQPGAVPAALRAVGVKADGVRHQMVAYAGRLTFHKAYREEVKARRRRWDALEVKPPWPLVASTGDQQPIPVVPGWVCSSYQQLPPSTGQFLDEATKFLRRWQLASLASWDLPLPQ